MIETLDTTVRLITVGSSTLLLLLLLTGDVRRPIKLALAGLLLSAISYIVNSSSTLSPTKPFGSLVDLASVFAPFWTWLFGRMLFEKEPPRWTAWAVVIILVLSWMQTHFLDSNALIGFYAIHLTSLLLVGDLLRVAFVYRADDLIEKRRLIRLWLPILVGLQAGGILLFETIVGRAIPYPPVQLVNALLIFALTIFAGLALLRTDGELLAEQAERPQDLKPEARLSPSEQVLSEKLDASMQDGFYRTAGLTITGLAEHLEVPEHRLRALINRGLGYRNFSAFLNYHRINEARDILANQEKVDLPILTIAMDLGYNSLATFNRAFRSETLTTPTDYRRKAITQN